MIKPRFFLSSIVILALAQLALAQEPGKMPKPGPEHKKLDYFVGKWTGSADMKGSPYGPAGTYSSTDDCQWFAGGFSVVCHSDGKGPMGPMKGLGIIGYDPEEKTYSYYGIDNMGMAELAKGTVEGDTWSFTSESKMGGKEVKSRYSMKELSPTSYGFKWEVQGEDGSWSTLMEGKESKLGAKTGGKAEPGEAKTK